MKNPTTNRYLKALGPGILFASTCIGVSHLVQSTRAGADYGFALLLAVILANFFKYPFFEFASRYTAATGESILDGYYKKGKWILIAYFMITIITMFIVTAAVTFVTGGLLGNLISAEIPTNTWGLIILILCVIILLFGKYKNLDGLLKLVGSVLLISTVVAFVSALIHGRVEAAPDFIPKEVFEPAGFIFLIALMGWMPTAVDISTWTSLWAEAKMKESGHIPTLKESLFDFNFGYLVTAFLAICFLTLGSLIVYGSGTELSNSSPVFASQIIAMFTESIGGWSYYIIAVAAFSTMFSTTIAVIDGYGRAVSRTVQLLFLPGAGSRRQYKIWIVVTSIGGYLIVAQFLNNLKALVDLAAIVSFVVAPLAAYLNYKVMFDKNIKAEFRPPHWLYLLSIAGLIFLSLFTLIYFFVLVDPDGVNALMEKF